MAQSAETYPRPTADRAGTLADVLHLYVSHGLPTGCSVEISAGRADGGAARDPPPSRGSGRVEDPAADEGGKHGHRDDARTHLTRSLSPAPLSSKRFGVSRLTASGMQRGSDHPAAGKHQESGCGETDGQDEQ
jgi:hypothetical protein